MTKSKHIKLGTPKTIGELKKVIENYSDNTPFNFFNQPIQSLFEVVIDDQKYIVFKEIE